MRMYADVKFDRNVTKEHYLSPGGYRMIADGKPFGFDFNNMWGDISEKDPTVVEFEFRYPDFYEGKEEDFDPRKITAIEEFFCFTGEYDEPEIHPVKLLSLAFDVDGKSIHIPEILLQGVVTDGKA